MSDVQAQSLVFHQLAPLVPVHRRKLANLARQFLALACVRVADENQECRVDRGEERFSIRREIMDDIDEDIGVLQHAVVKLWALLSQAAAARAPLLRLDFSRSRTV